MSQFVPRIPLALCACFLAAGCSAAAPHPAPPSRQPTMTLRPPSGQAEDPEAFLPLEQILPTPQLRPTVIAPATGPARRPPLDALQLYARSRAALAGGQRYTAIDFLERAIALDPYSFELQYALGKIYEAGEPAEQTGAQAVKAFERAAAIRPDHLLLQYRLGRLLLSRGDTAKALYHLRAALETSDYKSDEDTAAMVDYYLARALDQRGYARAALDRYDQLLHRLRRPLPQRSSVEWFALLSHPEIIYYEVGTLYEKHRDYAQALGAYQAALDCGSAVPPPKEGAGGSWKGSETFEVRARIVRLLAASGRGPEAEAGARKLVALSHASSESLDLLRDVYHRLSHDVAGALAQLYRQAPTDHALLFAAFDAYKSAGNIAAAETLLQDARRGPLPPRPADADSFEWQLLQRQFALRHDADDVDGAARLLIETLADRPDALDDVTRLWERLLRPAHGRPLRLAALQKLKVAPAAEASRLYWLARTAALWDRDSLVQPALEQSAARRPPFAPASRLLVDYYWRRDDWDDAQKARACAALSAGVKTAGGAALAAELDAASAAHHKDAAAAFKSLDEAARLGDASPQSRLLRADLYADEGKDDKAEPLLWEIVARWPRDESAYGALFGLYARRHDGGGAQRVVRQWLDADPASVDARELEANLARAAGQSAVAEGILLKLFADQPDSAQVLAGLRDYFSQAGRLGEWVEKLEAEHASHPQNRQSAAMLVELYASQRRAGDAVRVLDQMRSAAARDPELLYGIAHLYDRVDRKETGEQVLGDVLKLDPTYPPANNDLGYLWAEAGRNLDRAEALIRTAVGEEPENQSYLDSLGWVSYKRGKFEQACDALGKAVGPATRPDPVVLDHWGDALYRLSRKDEAAREWDRSLHRLDEQAAEGAGARDDLRHLREQLTRKLEQSRQGGRVDVAPTAAEAAREADGR